MPLPGSLLGPEGSRFSAPDSTVGPRVRESGTALGLTGRTGAVPD